MKAKVGLIFLLVVAFAVVVTACAPAPTPVPTAAPATAAPTQPPAATKAPAATSAPAATTAPTTAPTAAPTAPPVTLQFWHFYGADPDKFYKEVVVPEFEKRNPGIKVQVKLIAYADYATTIKTAFAGGIAPDLFVMYPISTLADLVAAGQVEDLTKIVTGSWKDRFIVGPLADCEIGGKLYMVPYDTNNYGVLYNKELFAKYNLQVPKTLDDLYAVNKTFQANGITTFGLNGGEQYEDGDLYFMIATQTAAPGMLRKADLGDLSWQTPELVEPFKIISAMAAAGVFPKGVTSVVHADSDVAFAKGQIALKWGIGSWSIGTLPNRIQGFNWDKYGIMPFPQVKAGAKVVSIGGWGKSIALSAKSQQKDAAIKFMDFMTSDWVQQRVASTTLNIPAIKGIDVAGLVPQTPILAQFAVQQVTAETRMIITSSVYDALVSGVQQLLDGKVTPEALAAQLDQASKSASRPWKK